MTTWLIASSLILIISVQSNDDHQALIEWVLERGGRVRPRSQHSVRTCPFVSLVIYALSMGYWTCAYCLPDQVDVRVHVDPLSGLRGLVAARDMEPGEVMLSIPESVAIALGPASATAPVSRAAGHYKAGRSVQHILLGLLPSYCVLANIQA